MLYRGFRYKAAVTNHVDGTDGTAFPTPDAVRIAEIAAAIKCPVTDVAAFETTTNPYPTATYVIPSVKAVVPPSVNAQINEQLAIVAADPALLPATKAALAAIVAALVP